MDAQPKDVIVCEITLPDTRGRVFLTMSGYDFDGKEVVKFADEVHTFDDALMLIGAARRQLTE